MTLSKRLHELRKRQSLTLEQLADRAGISKPYVWQLENEPDKRPSGEVLLKLATALGTTVGYLLGAPMAVPQSNAVEIPASLAEFIRDYEKSHPEGMSAEDRAMLAGIRYRGNQPRSKGEWELIYTSIKNTIGRGRQG